MGVLRDTCGNVERVVDRNTIAVREADGITLALKVMSDALGRLEAEADGLLGKAGVALCQEPNVTRPGNVDDSEKTRRAPSPIRAELFALTNRVNAVRDVIADLCNRLDV